LWIKDTNAEASETTKFCIVEKLDYTRATSRNLHAQAGLFI